MSNSSQSKLEYWFSDLDRKIDDYDADLVIAEIRLRALKDEIDPDSSEVQAVTRQFQAEVKAHNNPFNQLKLLDEQITKRRTQLAILAGTRIAKSASQRAFLANSKNLGVEIATREVRANLETLEADRNGNPAYQLLKLQASTPESKHHQFREIQGKPDWVHIECAGGCGRYVELRKKKVGDASYYVCNSVANGKQCERSLPALEAGQIKSISFNSAGSFTGITYKWPTPAQQASVARARGILASGMTSLLIEKAKKTP